MDSGYSALLFFGLLISLGMVGGAVARRVRMPALTGQILVGVLLASLAHHFHIELERLSMTPISAFALSLVAVTIGGHLEFRRLHNARRRIFLITVVQTTITFVLVLGAFQWLNPFGLSAHYRWPLHMVLASLATSSSPVSVILLLKEKRARGLVAKTAIGVVAINNLLAILVFEIFNTYALNLLAEDGGPHPALSAALAGLGLVLSVAIGAAAALLLDRYCLYIGSRTSAEGDPQSHYARHLMQGLLFTSFLVAISITAGACSLLSRRFASYGLHPSPILANMTLGLVLANRSRFKEELLGIFDVLEHTVFTTFFVLAGFHLRLTDLPVAGAAAALYFAMRMGGKLAGGWLGGRLAGATDKVRRYTGMVLLPQGAIAIALLFVLEQTRAYEHFVPLLDACVLTACVLSELIGAPLSGHALERAGEARRARLRLIEFLQEEFIIPQLRVADKWEALDKLSYFIAGSQAVETSATDLRRAVREREESMPTGIGHGIAVPHAKVASGKEIIGALALLDPPVDFGAPDGEPARLVVMVVTPERSAHRHLEVISALSRMFADARMRERIFRAETAEEVHEIIDSGDAETFNYFLET